MFVCVDLQDGICMAWSQFSVIPVLSFDDAVLLGFSFLGLSAAAFGCSFLANTILGKR